MKWVSLSFNLIIHVVFIFFTTVYYLFSYDLLAVEIDKTFRMELPSSVPGTVVAGA